MQDTYRHLGMRRRLVDALVAEYPFSEAVQEAMLKVPRHFFFEKAFVEKAYENKAFPIGEAQTISQPLTVAYQTEWLQIEPSMRVLEVGTGSGYQACVIAAMGAKVYSIERNRILHEKATQLIQRMHYNDRIVTLLGDGYQGAKAYAPFDRIIITAAAPDLPNELIAQLKIGGKLIVPLGKDDAQIMTLVTKIDDEHTETHSYGQFRFVPMLKGIVE